MGRKSSMSVLALMLSSMRQITMVMATSEMVIIGPEKYQSPMRNLKIASFGGSSLVPRLISPNRAVGNGEQTARMIQTRLFDFFDLDLAMDFPMRNVELGTRNESRES